MERGRRFLIWIWSWCTPLPCAYRESFTFGGYPVEAFVHDPATLEYFFLEVDRPSGVPALAQMVVEGIEIPASSAGVKELFFWTALSKPMDALQMSSWCIRLLRSSMRQVLQRSNSGASLRAHWQANPFP